MVVLPKLSLLAKWLARKTPLRKPNRGEGIVSRKPRPKSAYDFLGLLYCFIVLLCICVVSCPYVIYYPTVMVRYSIFVLKVPLNPSKQTNNQISWDLLWIIGAVLGGHFSWWHQWLISSWVLAESRLYQTDINYLIDWTKLLTILQNIVDQTDKGKKWAVLRR